MRVLFLTHRLPYAPNRGDRVRSYHMLRFLSAHADVDVLSLTHDRGEEAHAPDLAGLASSVTTVPVPRLRNLIRAAAALSGPSALTHVLLDAPELAQAVARTVAQHPPDIVIAYCSGMARLAFEPCLVNRPLILDMVDVDSGKWKELAAVSAAPRRWVFAREADRLATFERRAIRHATATLVVNGREAAAAHQLAPDVPVHVVTNGIDVAALRRPALADVEGRVVFCGVMNYGPNEEGVRWFVREVWPRVRARRPDATFVVVGSNPTRALRVACAADASIEVTGSVPDVRPFLWDATVSVAPLRVARGLQNKVLEAAAAGLPSVVTPAVMQGLPGQMAPACLVAEGAQAFADATLRLLDVTAAERRASLESANLGSMDWSFCLQPLASLLERLHPARGVNAARSAGGSSSRPLPVQV